MCKRIDVLNACIYAIAGSISIETFHEETDTLCLRVLRDAQACTVVEAITLFSNVKAFIGHVKSHLEFIPAGIVMIDVFTDCLVRVLSFCSASLQQKVVVMG